MSGNPYPSVSRASGTYSRKVYELGPNQDYVLSYGYNDPLRYASAAASRSTSDGDFVRTNPYWVARFEQYGKIDKVVYQGRYRYDTKSDAMPRVLPGMTRFVAHTAGVLATDGQFSSSSFHHWMPPYYQNRIQVRLYSKAANTLIDISLHIVEARKTASLILDLSTSVVNSMIALRAGKFKKAARLLGLTPKEVFHSKHGRSWSDRFLQWKYAVAPTLSDIATYQRGLTSQLSTGIPIKYNTSVKEEIDYRDGHTRIKGIANHRGTLNYKMQTSDVAFLSQFGLATPSNTLWEAVPFSFVWDWFNPIGEYLLALQAIRLSSDSYGSLSTKVELSCIYRNHITVGEGHDNTDASQVLTGYHRVPMGAPRISPYMKSPFSTDHFVTSLALYNTLRRKKP